MRELVRQLRAHGHDTELVSVPFKWYPKPEILTHAAAWRLLDLSESNGRPIDLVIATKFPTYFARHACKVAWLIHQHRAAYELAGTPFSDFTHTEDDVALRERIVALDTRDARRVPAAVHELGEHRGAGQRDSTACPPSRSTIRRGSPTGCAPATPDLSCCRSAGWNR